MNSLSEEIEKDAQELLSTAKRQSWQPEFLEHELAAFVLCQYRTPVLITWLRESGRPVPKIHFQNHVVNYAAKLVSRERPR